MSFSASTCLSYTGTTTLTEPISIFTLSGEFITAVTLNQITNCPLVLTGIPDDTTTITLKSANFFCCDVPLTCNDLCTTCDLSFDSYSTSLISRIVAGNLTGSCQSSILDYKINWYKSPDFTTPIFTSGYGSSFTPYNYTHPLTGASSPMQPAGAYTPIIDKIKLNGLNYSQTVQPGFIQANLECFNTTTVNVLPFTCDNGSGTSDLPNYTHRVQFSGASAGVTPLMMTSTFNLDTTTKYFAWKFKGEGIPDSLKISFNGSSYPNNPLILEYWTIGNQPNTNPSPSLIPQSASTTGYVNKVTSLMSLSRNVGDTLTLEVIPNPANFQTNWDFYFTCLNTDFSCSLGCLNSYLSSPYKIKLSSVTLTPQSCGRQQVSYDISGCTQNEINSLDITKYMETSFGGIQTNITNLGTSNTTSLRNQSYTFTTGNTSCVINTNVDSALVCVTPNTNIIRFQKTIDAGVGVINMEFTNLTDLNAYKTSYDGQKSSSGWVNDPTNLSYYRYGQLYIPSATGSTNCGADGTGSLSYNVHYSSVMTTGFTAGTYTLTLTMPTITNSMPSFGPCELDCGTRVNTVVFNINTQSTGTTNNTVGFRTTNTGSRYINPFAIRISITLRPTGSPIYSGFSSSNNAIINTNLTLTVPFSGNPSTIIPSLSAQTCDFSSVGVTSPTGTNIYIFDYVAVVTNPPDLTAFTIKANPISNGVRLFTNYPDTVLTYSGGTVTSSNPLYTF
jgi:hypothetical protein